VAGDQVVERAVPQALHALVFHADDLHWDVAGGRVLLQMIQHGPTEHVRQKNIQHDRQWIELAGQRPSVSAVGGDHAFESFVSDHVQQDPAEMGIVLYYENNRITGQHGFAVIIDRFHFLRLLHDQWRWNDRRSGIA
jgi:hypothetical protein